jgi:L-malate glycosyltransferase
MEIHQILHSAAAGDAVTNSALHYRSLLRRIGPSEVYAAHIHPALAGNVLPLSSYDSRPSSRSGANLLLYHLSIGSAEVLAFLLARRERVGVVYHNITPSEYFRAYDSDLADDVDEGRRQLALLRDRADLAIAVSSYNAGELEAIGYRNVRVAAAVADPEHLLTVTPDAGLMASLQASLDGPLVLFVGQLLPHKRPDLLMAAYHVLVTYLLPEAHLAFVGPARLPGYGLAIQRFARELNLRRVRFYGWVRNEDLAALYRNADLLVTTSEHEGFCVPLLEAMGFGVPVVARAFAAIPDTLGDGGLLLPPDADALLIAEAMYAVLGDEAVRDDLVARGRARLEELDPAAAQTSFLEALLETV